MCYAIRGSAFVILLMLCSACADSRPTAPTAVTVSTPTAVAVPAPAPRVFPPLEGSSRTFNFERALSYSVRDYTRGSRFVLFDNGAFMLEYPHIPGYRGKYTESNGVLTFEWEGWSTAGPWGATGTIKGDSLAVEYNLIMMLSDFEDAVYAIRP